jgi:hypothetical protein
LLDSNLKSIKDPFIKSIDFNNSSYNNEDLEWEV